MNTHYRSYLRIFLLVLICTLGWFEAVGQPVREIDVLGNGVSITSGSTTPNLNNHTDFGTIPACTGYIDRNFVITNSGSGQLLLVSVGISGANSADFSFQSSPAANTLLPANGMVNLTLRFDPSAVGIRNASITILNNDADESTYTFAIAGEGLADVVLPTISCPAAQVANIGTGVCTANVNYINPVTNDNCTANPTLLQTAGLASGSAFPIGTTTNTYRVTDASGNTNTCSFTVTVLDNVAPTAICQDLTVTLNGSGIASTASNAMNNGSTDNCGIPNTVMSKFNFSCTDLGPNNVTLTATDAGGNTHTCTGTVTVTDVTAPTALCHGVVVNLDGSGDGSTTASAVNNGSSDNCSFTMSLSQTNFNCANRGANTVTFTATDGSGNMASCSTTVTVQDNLPPIAVCQAITLTLSPAGTASTSAAAINNASSDNCGITNMVLSNVNFNCTSIGTNPVTLTVTDVAMNTGTCTANVTVEDNIPPVAHCQNITLTLDAQGNASTTAATINNGSTDNCSVSLSLSQTTFSCANIGPNSVTLTVTDGSGNSDTCSATVRVVSQILNVVVTPVQRPCGPHHISCAGGHDGVAHVTATVGCGGTSYNWSDGSSLASAYGLSVGTNYVTVTDISGNIVIDTFEITAPDPMTVFHDPIDSICPEDSNGTLSISATSPNECTGHGLGYAWSNGATTPSINNLVPGSYTVTVTDDQGCSLIQQLTVPAFPSPTPGFTISGNLLTSTLSYAHYQWSFNGNPISGANFLEYEYDSLGIYTLTVIDANGCEGTSLPQTITHSWEPISEAWDLRILPNPARSTCFLHTKSPISAVLNLTIYDVYGRVLSQQVLQGLEKDVQLVITGFAAGHYWVAVLAEDGRRQLLRFVVQ